MDKPSMQGIPAAAILVAGSLLASCGSGAPNRRAAEYLDESTAATITRAEAPIVLYSEDPSRAANARDYLYVAPLVVNQSGRHSVWLWLGLWSTIDRGVSRGDARPTDFADMALIVDGEPMELDLETRSDRIPGVGRLPYAAPVATATSILLPLTGSQLTRLSHAGSMLVYTETSDGEAQLWQAWHGDAKGTGFPGLTAAASVVP